MLQQTVPLHKPVDSSSTKINQSDTPQLTSSQSCQMVEQSISHGFRFCHKVEKEGAAKEGAAKTNY